MFLATKKDESKCKDRDCRFAHYRAVDLIPEAKLQAFLEKVRCTGEELKLFNRHFGKQGATGGAGGAAAAGNDA